MAAALVLGSSFAGGSVRRPLAMDRLIVPPGYYRPALVDGMVFPVARSNFFSLTEFTNDWHDPRLRFIDGRWRLVGFHEGVDITAEAGTPVLSVTNGVVERVGWTFYSGLRVGVRGTDGRYYFYAHLSGTGQNIRPGVRVSAGSEVGRVGNTGYGDPGQRDMFPPHLHFGIEGTSGWVNPYPLVRSLYRKTVAVHRRREAAVERLAVRGDRQAWERAAERLLMNPEVVRGE